VKDQLTIPAIYIKTMLSLAQDRGIDCQELLSSVGIIQKDLDADLACSALSYGKLHHSITSATSDEWFGMLSGGPVPKGAIGFLCRAAVHSKTLEDAALRSADFCEICRGFKVKIVIVTENKMSVLKIVNLDSIDVADFNNLMATTSARTLKSTVTAWHGFLSWLIGQEIPLESVHYTFSTIHQTDIKNNRFPAHYNQDFCGFRFRTKYLKMPVLQQEKNVEDFLHKAPYYAFIRNSSILETQVQKVKSLMLKSIGSDFPQAQEVADSLNISVTTLHRKLGQEDSSFQKIKDEVRMEAAIHYLNSPDISTSVISELVGFEDPSAFYRSFKKWTGFPPGEYRKKLLT